MGNRRWKVLLCHGVPDRRFEADGPCAVFHVPYYCEMRGRNLAWIDPNLYSFFFSQISSMATNEDCLPMVLPASTAKSARNCQDKRICLGMGHQTRSYFSPYFCPDLMALV